MLFTNILPEAIIVYNAYGAWVTSYFICVQTFVVMRANSQLQVHLACLEMYCLRLRVV